MSYQEVANETELVVSCLSRRFQEEPRHLVLEHAFVIYVYPFYFKTAMTADDQKRLQTRITV